MFNIFIFGGLERLELHPEYCFYCSFRRSGMVVFNLNNARLSPTCSCMYVLDTRWHLLIIFFYVNVLYIIMCMRWFVIKISRRVMLSLHDLDTYLYSILVALLMVVLLNDFRTLFLYVCAFQYLPALPNNL